MYFNNLSVHVKIMDASGNLPNAPRIYDHKIGFDAPKTLVTRKCMFSNNYFCYVTRPDRNGVPYRYTSSYFNIVVVQLKSCIHFQ